MVRLAPGGRHRKLPLGPDLADGRLVPLPRVSDVRRRRADLRERLGEPRDGLRPRRQEPLPARLLGLSGHARTRRGPALGGGSEIPLRRLGRRLVASDLIDGPRAGRRNRRPLALDRQPRHHRRQPGLRRFLRRTLQDERHRADALQTDVSQLRGRPRPQHRRPSPNYRDPRLRRRPRTPNHGDHHLRPSRPLRTHRPRDEKTRPIRRRRRPPPRRRLPSPLRLWSS
mmetsp:Transcript_14396/g.46953  ORF Transcript_14396/g.46953 Transcript_14396/m.46953 type:complete len:227 (-) Transcript_14396:1898-2578(-)